MIDEKQSARDSLAGDSVLLQRLPPTIRSLLLTSTGTDFLQAVAQAGLVPGCTERIFIHCNHLISEIAARWIHLSSQQSASLHDRIAILECFARIFPLARYLRSTIKDFFSNSNFEEVLTQSTEDSDLAALLLAIFRLISSDPVHFTNFVRPTFLSSFFSHKSPVIRYLGIQCMCVVMRFADALEENLICSYLPNGSIIGPWEGKEIDYRLLKLFETKRWLDLDRKLNHRHTTADGFLLTSSQRFDYADLSPTTASIGGTLVPRDKPLQNVPTPFVETPTAVKNLRLIGQSLLEHKPILIIGPSNSGKSTLVRESARLSNSLSSIIVLHLNEQTDAKSLLGIYTSSESGDSFVWKPGVLTRAVQQGRWVVIEDIDRAPSEVLGVLRPMIENGELFLPSRKETIRPKEGFRVFATIKTSDSAANGNIGRHAWLTNKRFWSIVEAEQYAPSEIQDLLQQRHAHITPLLDNIMRAHDSVCHAYRDDALFRAVQARLPCLRDLLKWCRRIDRRVQSQNLNLTSSGMPEQIRVDIFKDGVDCYAAHHSDMHVYSAITQRIAQAFNISPQQMAHSLSAETSTFSETKTQIDIGRSTLAKIEKRRSSTAKRATFAMTDQAKRTLDSIAAATSNSEPLLLVGETGVGKTTQVQHVANLVNQNLTVVNLSQQSEATDLLGGLKPLTTRSLIIPMVDQFSALFDDTFSSKRNGKFQLAISKAIAKENWSRLVLLWREAVQMAEASLKKPFETAEANAESQQAKRRKLVNKYGPLRDRWSDFSSKLKHIQVQVERGDKNHSFAFVEGRLVQAVRNGDWLLLDEINLASADTLDYILGLLSNADDERPSVLLAEAGNAEKVIAHPNFRIFAAMNPATDTGKKDLAPGVRSRFTEIYVQSGDQNADDLVKIIEVYLGAALSSDKRAALDLARAYLQLKKLNEDHKLTDGAGDVPHFSIRSLVRCLLYVVLHYASHGLRRSIYEGFAMSFFTVLSIESEALALPLITNHLLGNVKNIQSFLKQQPKASPSDTEYVPFEHHLVLRGPNSPDLQPHYIKTPSVERNLKNLARAASMRRFPILLQGPTSAGKTSMVEFLAKRTGNEFVRINNHEHTDLQEYLGSYATGDDGRLQFREGILVEALRKGHWIVLDELNLAPSDVLEALNRLLDDNRELLIPESQEIVRPHPRFMLFATQNPAGLYGGRKRLSRAFRNRFLELHFDNIPESELEAILIKRTQIAPSFCNYIVKVYKDLTLQRQATRLFESGNSFATLRDLFRWAARSVPDKQQLAKQGFMLLAERVREPAERSLVKDTIEKIIGVKINEQELYSEQAIPEIARLQAGVIWTPAMRRLYVLVSEALVSNEPVLLVGETGCGKTQICQSVAKAFQRNLNIYNAHSNTETGDLIGSQRPVRQRSDLATAVLDNFNCLYTSGATHRAIENKDIDALIAEFDNMDTSSLETNIVERTRRSIAAYQSLFTWGDGSLVRSMKSGEHFLLDEISLADDSVLERLNSLLEPSRTILLAEKGPIDNVVVADSRFQFLATMNPGGDYGKRELSAALRNRLTEIWVPPLSQAHDILPILQAKLDHAKRHFGRPMLDFATWFKEHMQSSSASAIPLRSLLTWVEFIGKNSQLDPDSAFVHGASMVFIDSLGANPAGLTSVISENVQVARAMCLKALQNLTSIDVDSLYNTVPHLHLAHDKLSVGNFSLSRHSVEERSVDLVFDAPTTLRNTMRVVRALQMYRPILLEGSPGVGKTAIVTALAEAAGKGLTRINLSDQTDLMDLFGADAPSEDENLGRFTWRDGPLLQAMQSGGWVLLDEMNLASQSVLEGLNSCLDHRHEVYIAELDKSFVCHPEFTLFAAQNPHHQGGGRKGLPASFVNRFTVVYADPFERDDLMLISHRRRPDVLEEELASIVNTIYECHNLIVRSPLFSSGGPWELNLRDVNRWLDLTREHSTLPPSHHFWCLVSQRFRSPAARRMLTEASLSLLDFEPELSLHHNLSARVYQLGTSFLERDPYQQHVHSSEAILSDQLPYAQSAITAINNNWPVIFVGPSGCGKTALIRQLAALRGAKLVEFSMNADVDTMDLIGGFEQHDVRRDILAVQKSVSHILLTMICESITDPTKSDEVAVLCAAYESIAAADSDLETVADAVARLAQRWTSFSEVVNTISKIRAESNITRFVWNDGILVDALQEGSWLVLDNANLCNPSVLDRLNSLLEPDGVLTVSEQHNSGDMERVINRHPNFRIFLTMDPRHGELSRAMRNRSLEIFIAVDQQADRRLDLPSYTSTASIYRFASLLQLSSGDFAQQNSIEPYCGLLSDADKMLVLPHLTNLVDDQDLGNCLKNNVEVLAFMSQVGRTTWSRILPDAHDGISHLGKSEVVCSLENPSLFLLNDALIRRLVKLSTFTEIRNYARQYLSEVQRAKLEKMLLHAVDTSSQTSRSNLSVLQQSISMQRSKQTSALIPQAYAFLSALIISTLKIDEVVTSEKEIAWYSSAVCLAEDMFAFFNQSRIELGTFRAYLQVARDLTYDQVSGHLDLYQGLERALSVFQDHFVLRSGQSLYRMWSLWKPVTPKTLSHLGAQIAIEDLITRLDRSARLLPQQRRESAAIRAQLSRAYLSISDDSNVDYTVTTLTNAVEVLAKQNPPSDSQHGHFASTFEHILQKLVIQGKNISELDFQQLSLFTRSLPIAFDQDSSIASTLRRLAYFNNDRLSEAKKISSQILGDLASMRSEPLCSLQYLQAELNELTYAAATHTVELLASNVTAILDHVHQILFGILTCHDDLFTLEARLCFQMNARMNFRGLAQLGDAALDMYGIQQVGHFRDIYRAYLLPVIVALAQQSLPPIQTGGLFLAVICTAALKLFVPDKAFDPAIYPAIISQRHGKRVVELESQIEAYKLFQRRFTGQNTSTLVTVLEEDLRKLGEAPTAPNVVRPGRSELDVVQQSFSTVLGNILSSTHLEAITDCLSTFPCDPDNISKACKVVQSSISRIVDRLCRLNRAYDDIVKPVQWLLESLSLGVKLMSDSLESSDATTGISKLGFVPLLGGSPSDITPSPQAMSRETRADMHSLDHVRFHSQIEQHSQQPTFKTVDTFLCLTDAFYVQWKTHLTKDQADAVAKSRYYAYRGEDEVAVDVDASEVATLFPTYEDEKNDEIESDEHSITYNARQVAVRLSELHCKLYETDIEVSLQEYIVQTMDKAVITDSNAGPLELAHALPGILLCLQKSTLEVNRAETATGINIYTDSDPVESRKLVDLVFRIKQRFREIADQWPEHAVPAEVLSFSDELLAFRIEEPIAKLLTKTEKLFEIVSQWQSVASREFSVNNLMEALTTMIIHWRRLELSSWSRLLENERLKFENDANAWYFIAYEAVLYNTRLIVDQTEDVTPYCRELTSTLEGFFQSATSGQFSMRLKLLKALSNTMNTMTSHDDRLLPIAQAIAAILFHYERYEPNVQQSLATGRAQLEKDITEQIKLASWRDTNIQSLRDSARRTHYKLFKVVKKYRSLLARPLITFKSIESNQSEDAARRPAISAPNVDSIQLQTASEICSQAFANWRIRPERLINPLGAATSIRKLFITRTAGLDVTREVNLFRKGVSETATDLRKQTPQSLTEENTSLVRDLKRLKRGLFVDTIRNVTQMGVRRNLASTELSKQASLSMILSSSSDIDTSTDPTTAHNANATFHEIIDHMPGVRSAAVEHSEDLTEGEARRAIGLLEGLLFISISQRADLSDAAKEMKAFQAILQPLQSLQNFPIDTITIAQRGVEYRKQWLQKCLAWLPMILETSCQILSFQSEHGKFDVSELTQLLRNQAAELKRTKAELQQLPELPTGFAASENDDRVLIIEADLGLFGNLLGHWSAQQPNIAYLIDQIIPWTMPFGTPMPYTNGAVVSSLEDLDNAVRRILDSVFVAMQNVASITLNQIGSTEEQGWLIKANKTSAQSLKALHLEQLSRDLSGVMSQIQHLPEHQLRQAVAVLNIATPVLEQYHIIAEHMYQSQLKMHLETNNLAVYLTRSFVSLAKEGFCSPQEPSNGQDQQSGKLESGTGLGDGEGAEDISKDVGEDEDLSDLAQAQAENQDGDQEMNKENDAVDMGADDFEGATGSGDERADEDEKAPGSEDEDDIDEETGSVDDLDPSAVDEKLWDDMQNEADKDEKEMKGDKQKGQKTDEQTAKQDDAKEGGDEEMEGMEETEANNEEQDDQADAQGRPEAENIDPHLQEDEALDLPDEMQLNGEEEGKEDDISNDGMDELSDRGDTDQPVSEQVENIDDGDMEERDEEADAELKGSEDDEDAEGRAQDDEVVEDQADSEENNEDNLDTRDNEMQYDIDEQDGGDVGAANQRESKANDDQDEDTTGQNEKDDVVDDQQTQAGKASDQEQTGDASRGMLEQGAGREQERRQEQNDALKQLADILEQYHQRREILTQSEDRQQGQLDRDIDMADADFEHVGDEEQEADAQALGAASADQVQKVDESKAIEDEGGDADQDLPMPEDQEMQELEHQETIAERLSRLHNEPRQSKQDQSGALVQNKKPEQRHTQSGAESDLSDDDFEHEDQLPVQVQAQSPGPQATSDADAAALWTQCSNQTHALSLLLTEQLRLILAPTTATKLRGDFRTGKRLNIKRIIPYIASGYKRDKIWMRRSVPSKRNYQIMIAVDDSKSMSESGADLLAFETLAMLCKSLSMLEVGDLCVVVFGDQDHIRVAHPFGHPFTGADSGTQIFKTFTFQQRGTDVRTLLRQSMAIFEDARLRAPADDLWQLQLIVSDGHCSDHEAIRRLVRAAHERKIVIVFVVVDAAKESIVDLLEARVEKVDPLDKKSDTRVVTKRYLEDFPFGYYVVVRDVGDLPGVLARVLRGWFESVVNVG